MTVAAVESLTELQAKKSVERAREHRTKFFEEIVWQVENRAWEVLGYESWDQMREAEYGDIDGKVSRSERPGYVARLRAAGLSQQQVADALGVGVGTVHRDVFHLENEGGARTDSLGRRQPTHKKRKEPEPVEGAEPWDIAAVNFFRNTIRPGLTQQAKDMDPKVRSHLIKDIEELLNTIKEFS